MLCNWSLTTQAYMAIWGLLTVQSFVFTISSWHVGKHVSLMYSPKVCHSHHGAQTYHGAETYHGAQAYHGARTYHGAQIQTVHSWLQVKGFNLRKWISAHSRQLPKMLDALGKLVLADKLKVAYTE